MRTLLPLLIALTFTAGCESCRREPAIVIRFEPIDASGQTTPTDLASTKAASADLAGAAVAAATKPTEAKKATACSKDADCVLEMADCCGCSQGGKQRAAHKKDKRTDAQKAKDCGETTMCVQALSTDPSCGKKAACIKNECTLQ